MSRFTNLFQEPEPVVVEAPVPEVVETPVQEVSDALEVTAVTSPKRTKKKLTAE